MQFYFFEHDTMEEHGSWMINLVSMKIGKLKVFGYVTGDNGLIWISESHYTKFCFWYLAHADWNARGFYMLETSKGSNFIPPSSAESKYHMGLEASNGYGTNTCTTYNM